MPHLARFQLNNGASILVEDDSPASGVGRVSRGADAVTAAVASLPDVLKQVRSVVDDTLTELRSTADSPSEIEIEFGVRLSGQFGAVMTKAGGEANLQVRLLWKQTREG
ncbi:CU044_2847 family protein [Actinorugispora endophytica]|uniref:Trypsin-co-occurring domain-containing protein n=1 Tax=Actinorugispora endophytica TaxID=1605990 RepID=A0A4R6V0M7_9ACTN|nr:CU044_2847 family protein [Actinorugispora endophytica]TDQ53460.1 hypothetical protein EV190_104250 [Actinorugispora endophytica]